MAPGMMGGPPMGGPGRHGGPPPFMGKRPGPGGPPPKPGGKPAFPDDFSEQEFDMKQMDKESEEMIKMTSLTSQNASFVKNSGGNLTLTLNGKNFEDIHLVETFPFTDPYSFISVRNPNNKNKEIGLIEDLERDFSESIVHIVKEHLDQRYHMPKIEKILQTKESGGYTHFTVQTDFGQTQFSLRPNGTYITPLDENRLIIQDSEGNRFEIPDKHRLSARDLKRLDVFL